jgi:hypothetical protein
MNPYPQYQQRFMRLAYVLVGLPMSFVVTLLFFLTDIERGLPIAAAGIMVSALALILAQIESSRWVGAALAVVESPFDDVRDEDPEVFKAAQVILQKKLAPFKAQLQGE